MTNYVEDLKKIFQDNLDKPINTIKLTDSLSTYINNSIDFIKVIVAIESKYDVEYSDQELELDNFSDIQSLVDSIIQKRS